MYEGKTTRLRRLASEDAKTIAQFWNNYELRQYLPTPLPSIEEDITQYIDTANDLFRQRKGFTFGIESKEQGKLVGLVNLVNISWMSKNAEIGQLAILNPEDWRRGYGFDAMKVVLDVAFNVLDLHSVYLWVAGFNERAIGFYKKVGFKDQGRLREMAFRNGNRHDVVVMDILRPEFLERYGILPKSGAF